MRNLLTDKLLHCLASAVLVVAFHKVLPIGWSALATFGIGVAKEVGWDWLLKKGTAEWFDLLADCIGIGLGCLLVL